MNGNNLSLYIQAQAVSAEIQGMIAENQRCAQNGEIPSYNEHDFYNLQQQLKEMSNFTT